MAQPNTARQSSPQERHESHRAGKRPFDKF